MDIRARVIITNTILFVTLIYVGKAASQGTFIFKLTDVAETKNKNKIVVAVEGLLQVRRNQETWKTMCYEWTDAKVQNVACRQMGYLGVNESNFDKAEPVDIISQNFSCPTGDEQNITFCTTPTPSTDKCRIVKDNLAVVVELKCNTNVGLLGLLNVELLGGDAHSGTLEYTRDGKKTRVCYDTSNAESVASVVCKQMGYSDKIKVSSVASNETEFARLECLGSEQTLDACTFKQHPSCTQSLVVAIECKLNMTSQNFFDVRLSSPDRSPSNGTVEVWKYGYWGVICDNEWTTQDADVVCRQLGYSKAADAHKNAMYGQGTGVVFWDKVNCTGNEFSIADCHHSTAVVSVPASTCDSTKAAGVTCDTTIQVESKDICEDTVESLEPGITFIRSPGFPETFEYSLSSNNVCSLNITSPTNITVYIQQKMFQNNHNESLSLKTSSGRVETLYGDHSTQGPMTFDTNSLTIEFQANGVAGKGKFNIMVTVPQPPPPSSTPSSTAVSSSSPTTGRPPMPTPGPRIEEPEDVNVGVIVGAIVGVVCLIAIGILVFVLCKKNKKLSFNSKRRNSVGSSDKSLDKSEHGGDNPNFIEDDALVMKENNLSGRTANGNTPQGVTLGNTDVYAEVPPKWKRKESKEPETGETKRNDSIGRPASGSDVKVDFANQAYKAYELEELPQLNDNPYKLEQPLNKGVESGTPGRSAPVDNVDGQLYAEVNKPWRVPKGQAPAAPRAQTHGTITENANQDIDNGNIDGGSDVVPPVVYADVNKPTSFIPGVSTAYADVEIGVCGAPSIQPEVPPKQETTEKETKKGKKKKKKKKKEEDKEEDKKKDKKGKDKKKKGLWSSDDVSDERPKGDICAVPMDNPSAGIYAEVGQTSMGQSGPVGGSQQVESDQTYDVLQRKRPNQRPAANVGVTDQTYDSVDYKV